MKKNLLTLIIVLIAFVQFGNAQKISIKSGSLDALKGQTKVNARYDYSNMAVGEYEKEQDYVKKKTSDYNGKEPGRGDDWAKKWVADRKNSFEPSFEELFEKYSGIDLSSNPDAKYTMIIHTTFTEPGFNVYVSRKNATINLEFTLVETANESNVICKIVMTKAPGRTVGGSDFDSGTRISESYAKAGKELGAFITDALK